MDFDAPTTLSLFVGAVGAVGILTAIWASIEIAGEAKLLLRFNTLIAEDQVSLDPYKNKPNEWLAQQGIKADSHVGDHLLTVWAGWLAGRAPTLSELHNLCARRERTRTSGRISGGIAAMLLVCGIAGTLWAIHPILNNFRIQISADGLPQEASQSARNVMNMIHGLGRAFYPSLTALALTLVVASFRGLYVHKANRLAWDLDRFTMDTLLPAFKTKSFGEELLEIQVKLAGVADAMNLRDSNLEKVISTLSEVVDDMKKAGPNLRRAAEKVVEASTKLAGDANSVLDGLNKNLGVDSPLVEAIKNFGFATTAFTKQSDILQRATESVGTTITGAASAMSDARDKLTNSINDLPTHVSEGFAEGSRVVVEACRQAASDSATEISNAVIVATEPVVRSIDVSAKGLSASSDALQKEAVRIPELIKEGCEKGHIIISKATIEAGTVVSETVDKATSNLTSTAHRIDNVIEAIQATNQTALHDLQATFAQASSGFQSTIASTVTNLNTLEERVENSQVALTVIYDRLSQLGVRPGPLRRAWTAISDRFRRR